MKNMESPIKYEKYDKISDSVLFLGQSTTLRFNVKLSKINSNNNGRYHFHREYKYYNDNYGDLYSIKRDFDYYFTIEKIDRSYNTMHSVMIRVQDIMLFKYKIQEILRWFNDDTFFIKNGKLMIHKREPIIVDGLACMQYLQFEPIVIEYDNSIVQGIRMTISDPEVFTDINIQNFYALAYTIDTFNMYQAALSIVNYLGRPEFGTNLYNVTDEESNSKNDGNVSGKNRQIGVYSDRKKSFFDD